MNNTLDQLGHDIMIYQIVRARSKRKKFVCWIVTLGVNLNAEMCFN
jgi:hypothetical protein